MSERVDIGEPGLATLRSHATTRSALEIASSRRIVRLALRMSLVVGSLLNLINQGDALFGSAQLDLFKLGLTYLVPYCVATYSATTVTLQRP